MERETQTPESAAPSGRTEVTGHEPVLENDLVDDELLVEEISIDGMCGVY